MISIPNLNTEKGCVGKILIFSIDTQLHGRKNISCEPAHRNHARQFKFRLYENLPKHKLYRY